MMKMENLKEINMRKAIRHVFKTEIFTLSECHDGYWLYDKSRGYNIAMRAKTEQDACIEALESYSRRLQQVESECEELNNKVINAASILMPLVDEDY
jgi:hypothetical protein